MNAQRIYFFPESWKENSKDVIFQRDVLVEALREIETICSESAGDCRRRMGTRAGNSLVIARAALAKVQP